MVHITFIRHLQFQGHPVKIKRHDRLEPFGELLVGGMLADTGQTTLPHITVCLVINYHHPVCFGRQNCK